MNRLTTKAALTIVVTGCIALGLGAGAAVAVAPTLLAPKGLSADQASARMPDPVYEQNGSGQTFGSAADSNAPGNEPDLIAAVATNGKEGYVLKAELADADGTTASESFTSPEEALAWQAGEGSKDHLITVYALDGKTIVGEFLVAGTASQ